MAYRPGGEIPAQWSEALKLMRSALELLDRAEASSDAAAHLDLAISRLECSLGSEAIHDVHRFRREIEKAFALLPGTQTDPLWDEKI